ncbi:carboxylesterase family protein [Neolewinella lacunae]|uniref:Carboxylic ester hydrolase n=1 Tax=Neolewinella lacunae TaxID=1517758 RepID=A0A923PM08_9BACT|nr:carboxylesterase family protein [Neolewinella lacunae]MBC6993739.1 carboxylesterase family protein [Neolewinella lacunae]MDN3635260.1 carboxylesterase family protein [Neolewinella lacunae]
MKYFLFASIILSVFFGCQAAPRTKKTPTLPVVELVQTSAGPVRGAESEGVLSFKGIPFAAPPVGSLRWRAPQPVATWTEEYRALEFAADCAQAGRGTPGTLANGSSEDCLYLNLWVPSATNQDAKLPVMVWIHGGAFVFGSGSSPAFAGEVFARQNVILVTHNYRLGRLGHFAFPALSEEHAEEGTGSYAYMDQIAALQWVKENIAAFGGDPGNVTIFGESAGGVSVHSLLTIPAAKGLFHKAISQSGGGRDGVLTGRPLRENDADRYYPVSAETIGINFARKHGINGTDAVALGQLRALDAAEIIDSGMEFYGEENIPIYTGPVLDGKLVVETAESAYLGGRQARVPLIIGSNSAEVPGGFVNASSKEELWKLFGAMGAEAQAVYDPAGTKELGEVLTKVNTDKVWAEPSHFTAEAWAKAKQAAFVYRFGYVPQVLDQRLVYGAPHASEIAYVFGNLNARWGVDTVTNEDQEVAKIMNTYWANFAKTGNPNGAGVPLWPAYAPRQRQIIEFERGGAAVGKTDTTTTRLDLIRRAVESKELH